jgi:Zinc finger, C2H2 type
MTSCEANSPSKNCLNCYSADVDLMDITDGSLGLNHSHRLVSFLEVYKFCKGDDPGPSAKVCGTCSRQFKNIYKLRVKQPKTEPNHGGTGPAKSSKSSKKHVCPRCPNSKEFSEASALKRHILGVHEGVKFKRELKVLCPLCGRKFTSEFHLQHHNGIHHRKEDEEPRFECYHCSKRFFSRPRLCQHMHAHHMDRANCFKCKLCQRRKVFRSQRTFDDHLKLHQPITACECVQCGLAMACYNDLLDHAYEKHREMSSYLDVMCATCKKTFTTVVGLRHHLNSNHMAKCEKCEVCGKTFSQKPMLKLHMFSHRQDCIYPFWCRDDKCVFRSKSRIT